MKISVNWMLDHIATSVSKLDVGYIVAKFNVHTAEIEHYEKFDLDLKNIFLTRVTSIEETGCLVRCDELNQSIQLTFRNDVQVGQLVLIRRQGELFGWELLQKYSSSKEGLFPAVDCSEDLIAGGWKQHCEDFDYILDVDNKSINHRPDLWGHRGIAREVAAFMGWQLKPLDQMLAKVEQLDFTTKSTINSDHVVNLEIKSTDVCTRFAALHCTKITHKASQIWMAMRLARIESKPINTIIDITNYVMFDISQPMHVFDAANFPDKKLTVRLGLSNEKLELLDDSKVKLTHKDIVIADGAGNPVALAGVMGGKQASFSNTAKEIIIESGSFQAAMVRNSATRAKITTEAATRFSKQLDPMQNTTALLRFVSIAQSLGVIGAVQEKLVSVGFIIQPLIIAIPHSFIESRLGIKIASTQIITLLEKLEFKVAINQSNVSSTSFVASILEWLEKKQAIDHQEATADIIYQITVPTLRITKDVTIPEDIVEEVVRLYGYDNIAYKRPNRLMKSFDVSPVMKLRKLKEYCAFAINMREVRDYLFYDESFLNRLNWYPKNAIAIKNPVSENWKVLITSLVPHLIKNVELNVHGHEQINLFEHNSIWTEVSSKESIEHKSLAGLFYGHKNKNFYDYKADVQGMFKACDVSVVWAKPTGEVEPWFDQLQVADLILDGVKFGRAGMLSSPFIRPVVKGQGFAFEYNAQLLINYKLLPKKFAPWSKYQTVSVDISMLVDALVKAGDLEKIILEVDDKIDQVSLVDFFEKESWAGKKSLTFRYRICDFEQNLTKEVIENITNKVTTMMVDQGAEIR